MREAWAGRNEVVQVDEGREIKRRFWTSKVFRSLAAVGLIGVGCPAASYGQASSTSTNGAVQVDAESSEPQLAAVRVTGSKDHSGYVPATVETGPYRGLDALDVPATVNVVTREVMDQQGDTGLYDALRNVAGVTRQQLNGLAYDQLAIRGIALDNRSSYYLNGVLPIDNNIWMPMEDHERVEVLKGASAMYYGFTVPAGIVNMVTRRTGNFTAT